MAANAYGFLEVWGLITGIEAADAMLKSAPVRLAARHETNPARITLVVEGDIGACAAALGAGHAAALRVGRVMGQRLIGRPEPDTEIFFGRPVARAVVPAVPPAAPATPSAASPRRGGPRLNRKKRT